VVKHFPIILEPGPATNTTRAWYFISTGITFFPYGKISAMLDSSQYLSYICTNIHKLVQQGGILSEVDQSVKLWKLFNNWTVPFYYTERKIIVKNNVLGLGSIVQFLTSIVMTAVDLLQLGIFCPREGIFSIIAAIQESMTKSAEIVLVTNAYIIIFASGFSGSVSILF
jgi:hypothetical protein